MTINKALYSSGQQGFQTPAEVLDAVREFRPIALDPCTVASNPVGARWFYTPDDDGLSLLWNLNQNEHDGCVFVNPPYGRSIKAWAEKIRQEAQRVPNAHFLFLVPARTETAWWKACQHDAVCFWHGRLRFVDPETGKPGPHSAPFPSALLYWGPSPLEFLDAFEDCGECCLPARTAHRLLGEAYNEGYESAEKYYQGYLGC